MKFEQRQLLWLLVVIMPPLVWFLYWAWRKKQSLVEQFVQGRLLNRLQVGVSTRRQKVRLVLMALAVAFTIVALARPQWGYAWEEAKQRGLDIVVAIDTSRSMLAEDIKPNRLARAKLAALDLLRLSKNDRLALVPFAGSAFLQCPLTLDEEAFRQSVNALDVGIIPQGGSAIAEAIQTSLKAYKEEEGDNHKVLVLITDGEDHEDGAVDAAREAAKEGMKIFTIGLGSPEGVFIPLPGSQERLRDSDGNVVLSRLNETLLQQIAGAAGGFYLNMRGSGSIEMLYEKGLAPLPKTEITAKLVRRYHERFYVPLGLAILCLLVEMFLPDRARSARRPSAVATSMAGASVTGLVLLFALAGNANAASPSNALRQYNAGKYEAARNEYEDLLVKKPDDARLNYNSGTAAYQAKKYDSAARSFTAALAAQDLNLQQRAFYNLGNTWYQLGAENDEAEEKIDAWEQAIRQYDGALILNPQDKDAEHNREFVKKKLEEFKKQQEQQQSQQGNQNDNQQQKDQQKKQKGKNKQKGSGQGDQGSEPDSQQKAKKPSRDKKEKKDGEGDKEKKDSGKKDKGDEKDDGKGERPEPDEQQAQSMVSAGQISMEEAKHLLDAQKGEERALIYKPVTPQKPQNRTFKDW